MDHGDGQVTLDDIFVRRLVRPGNSGSDELQEM